MMAGPFSVEMFEEMLRLHGLMNREKKEATSRKNGFLWCVCLRGCAVSPACLRRVCPPLLGGLAWLRGVCVCVAGCVVVVGVRGAPFPLPFFLFLPVFASLLGQHQVNL